MMREIRRRLFDPRVSRGLHVGLLGWLYVLLEVLLHLLVRGIESVSRFVGTVWAPQDSSAWVMPVYLLARPLLFLAFPLLPALGVIGSVWSIVDLFRRKWWALLGLALSVALPLLVLWAVMTMPGGGRQASRADGSDRARTHGGARR